MAVSYPGLLAERRTFSESGLFPSSVKSHVIYYSQSASVVHESLMGLFMEVYFPKTIS